MMIEGVKVKELVRHEDYRGYFQEIFRTDDGLVDKIAQVSLSITKPGIIKAFHWHKYQDDCFYVLSGKIRLVLYDAREDSKTKGQLQDFVLGDPHNQIVLIPARVLHGYKVLGEKEAALIYATNNAYNSNNPDEGRVPFDDPKINYN